MSTEPKYYSIKELFSSDSYIIPIYQRNYAWGEAEITQLIQDIVDYYESDTNYYIGTLIAYERKMEGKSIFETIDGQQRLTTLIILLNLIKNKDTDKKIDWSFYEKLNLSFDSRPLSTNTLQYLFNGDENIDGKDCNTAIAQGYEIAKKALGKISTDSIHDFYSYLFNKVKILRVLVPEDTDLNHYFEIMNSRGEQLEKHEILKAKMFEILKHDEHDKYVFSLIWEACSNMEKYVQYGFEPTDRNYIFSENWDTLGSMDEIYKLNENKKDSSNSESISIVNLLNEPVAEQNPETETNNEDRPERFNTIINFPNFLLHILRIQTKQDIPLDDKRLIKSFDDFLEKDTQNEDEKKEFVKRFGYNLLKGKFLLDKYVIKKEYAKGTDSWSLKRLKYDKNTVSYVNTFGEEYSKDDMNREILMLLSMFHVSSSAPTYKHWLNAALKYLFEKYSEKQEIPAQAYKEYLEELAKAFLYDWILAEETKRAKNYFEIIYTNNGTAQNTAADIDEEKLNQGTAVENFIFNYLDYLLWQDYRKEKIYFKGTFKEDNETLINGNGNDEKIANFEYTFRSSVEHYYPQHPIGDNPKIEDKWLNNFGNLCLISSSKNSRLSNYMPNAKKDHYKNSPTIDSIKQRIMMEYESWDIAGENNINEIEQHGNKMKEILLMKKN